MLNSELGFLGAGVDKGGDAISGRTGERTGGVPASGAHPRGGDSTAGVLCSALGCPKPAGHTTCMEARAEASRRSRGGARGAAVVRRVGKRRSESGGFSCRWRRSGSLDPSPHSALSHSPRPPADFSGAIKCCLKRVLSLIRMKALGKQSSGNTVGCSCSWTSVHCKARVSRAILDLDGRAGPHSSA